MNQHSLASRLRQISQRTRHWNDYPAPRHTRSAQAWTTPPPILTDSLESEQQRDEALRRVEGILLLSREPLSSRKLSQHANLADATEARTLVRQLNEYYDESGRAFRVEEVAGGFQLLTRPQFAPWLRRLEHAPQEVRLSAPALETLAVVAYRQPTLRADVEAIRGVSCGELLRQLMERDLIRIQGRSEELGRPYLYGTTKHFLQVFGLKNLDKLPRAEEMKQAVVAPAGENTIHHQVELGGKPATLEGSMEDPSVTTATDLASVETTPEDELLSSTPRNESDEFEDDEFEDDEFEDDDDDDDDFDDDDDDDDDDFDDDDDDDDFDDDDDDDDFEDDDDFDEDDEEWEEVEDDAEDEDWDDDDDDDDDWDDDEDEDDEDWED